MQVARGGEYLFDLLQLCVSLVPFLQQIYQLLQTCHLMPGLSCGRHLPKVSHLKE